MRSHRKRPAEESLRRPAWEEHPIDLEERFDQSAQFSPAEFRVSRTKTAELQPLPPARSHLDDELDLSDLRPEEEPSEALVPARERSSRNAAGHAISYKAAQSAADSDHPLATFRPALTPASQKAHKYELIYRNYKPELARFDEPLLPLPEDTVLLRVALFDKKIKRQEWIVHGTLSLLDLRRVLDCSTSQKLTYQYEKLVEQGAGETVTLPSDSALFYLEGAFYIDGELDLSAEPREWFKARGHSSPPPMQMREWSFEQLWLTLGKPYHFLHQGSCEHTIVFTECWKATQADCQDRRAYPVLDFQRKMAPRNCSVCQRLPAAVECHGDQQADAWPTHLCESCNYQFHYSADGKLLREDYKAWKYWV